VFSSLYTNPGKFGAKKHLTKKVPLLQQAHIHFPPYDVNALSTFSDPHIRYTALIGCSLGFGIFLSIFSVFLEGERCSVFVWGGLVLDTRLNHGWDDHGLKLRLHFNFTQVQVIVVAPL
jgi:hypothetical protein